MYLMTKNDPQLFFCPEYRGGTSELALVIGFNYQVRLVPSPCRSIIEMAIEQLIDQTDIRHVLVTFEK
jgi:hypothetical protein